jgi:hypothetical protein
MDDHGQNPGESEEEKFDLRDAEYHQYLLLRLDDPNVRRGTASKNASAAGLIQDYMKPIEESVKVE